METSSRISLAPDQSHSQPAGCRSRAIRFIDIENLIRKPRPTLEDVQRARGAYFAIDPHHHGDLTVIACNHGASQAVGFGWPGARLCIRSGQDGADLALLEAMKIENVPARFTRATIASGDGIFAEAVASLESSGVEVTVVHPSDGLSARLRMASSRQLRFQFDWLQGTQTVGRAA